jgi:hypothetical protein
LRAFRDLYVRWFNEQVSISLLSFTFGFPIVLVLFESGPDLAYGLSFNLSIKKKRANIIYTAENQWLHLPLITKLKKDCKEVFPTVEYAYTTIPTYPSGQIGFMVCCKDANRDVTKPIRSWTAAEEDKLCRYYNAEIHKASFVLPTFARTALR